MTNSFVGTITVAGALFFMLAPGAQYAWAEMPAVLQRGGQAPPAAAGGQGEFLVVVASGLGQATADQLQKGLVAEGFTTAESRAGDDGKYRVVIGGLPSDARANQLLSELRSSGYTPQGVDKPGTADASDAGDSVYRVKVADFSNEQEAESAQKTLAAEGFVNVDVVPKDGSFMLMLGTFNRRQDAEALLSDVSGAGFMMAQVVERERLRDQSADSGTSADMTGLSASEQADMREVLAMAQKVASGEATAAEAKQLRERIQQLNAGQKNVVNQQESSRATEREKLQKIFPLYRKFDHAMAARDYDAAEKALAEVRQIDPTDIFIAGRARALEQARSGGTPAGPAGRPDPAVIQATINEARKLEGAGNTQQALAKYQEVVAMDPTNSEARGKVAQLSSGTASGAAPAQPNADDDAGAAGLLENKNLLYGAIGVIALIIIVLFLKSRKSKKSTPAAAPAAGFGTSTGPDFVDPLTSGGAFATGAEGNSGTTSATPASTPAFETFGESEEEEEAPLPKPQPAPAAPVAEESDVVSLEGFDSPTAVPPASAPGPAEEETISVNFAEETSPAAQSQTPAAGSSALDADLEALLKGTFPGASADAANESVLASATPGRGVEDLETEAQSSEPGEPRLVFEQSFEHEPEGELPQGWRGEYDYATLTVQNLDEAGHTRALCFNKPEGTGSATYHLSFPEARGLVTAEFDVRCDQKNKFLLGVYLEKDEDFKQSVHTIVHQLDASAPAALRIQGAATPYDMSTWCHVRYEIDLQNSTVDGYVDNEQVVSAAALANAPEFINTLSIRDNLATTGTLFLDNIRISEA